MGEVFLLYLFTRLTAFSYVVTGFIGLSALFTAVLGISYLDASDKGKVELQKHYAKRWKIALACMCFVCFIQGALPTKTDLAVIVGGKITLDAVRTDEAKQIGSELLEVLHYQLKQAAGK